MIVLSGKTDVDLNFVAITVNYPVILAMSMHGQILLDSSGNYFDAKNVIKERNLRNYQFVIIWKSKDSHAFCASLEYNCILLF